MAKKHVAKKAKLTSKSLRALIKKLKAKALKPKDGLYRIEF